jgi:DNA-binding GntR family transcriptional regulator
MSGARVADVTDAPDDLAVAKLPAGKSLREQVAHALRAAVVAGKMRPGIVYSVPTLAERFGVSITPVREAMLDLAKEGLLDVVRNKGFRVTELSDDDLDELTELRALIEIPTVAQLASSIESGEVEALRPLAQAIVDSAEHGDLIRYLEEDRRFHVQLLAHAGNRRLVKVVSGLRSQARLYGLDQLVQQGRLVTSAAEHHELLDALAAGDADQTEAVMRRHIGHVRGIWAAVPED